MSQWEQEAAGSLRVRFPELGNSGVKIEGEEVHVSASDGAFILSIRACDDLWIVESQEGHVHLESPDEAVEIATMLLMGNARFTNEYRGNVLAAAWLEMQEGDRYKTGRTTVYFLNPYDIDEWEVWPDEKWRQIRTVRSVVKSTGLVELSTKERTSDTSTFGPPDSISWFANGLGDPPPGQKWMEFRQRFVFLVPKGWRKISKSDDQFIDFRGPDTGPILRARNYYRDADPQPAEAIPHAVYPLSIEYTKDTTDPNWVQHTWTMIFTNGRDDMMGIIDFFHMPTEEGEAQKLFPIVEAGISRSLFTPNDWDMKA